MYLYEQKSFFTRKHLQTSKHSMKACEVTFITTLYIYCCLLNIVCELGPLVLQATNIYV